MGRKQVYDTNLQIYSMVYDPVKVQKIAQV